MQQVPCSSASPWGQPRFQICASPRGRPLPRGDRQRGRCRSRNTRPGPGSRVASGRQTGSRPGERHVRRVGLLGSRDRQRGPPARDAGDGGRRPFRAAPATHGWSRWQRREITPAPMWVQVPAGGLASNVKQAKRKPEPPGTAEQGTRHRWEREAGGTRQCWLQGGLLILESGSHSGSLTGEATQSRQAVPWGCCNPACVPLAGRKGTIF